ncbi:MAG: hypothetical protein WD708_07990 [Kiritimatiellia bacterium]
MSAPEETESSSPPKKDKITFKSPAGPKKSMLTHVRESGKALKPVSETPPEVSSEDPVAAAPKDPADAPPDGSSGRVSAEPVPATSDTSAALSGKMAKISSIRDSTGFRESDPAWKEKAGAASTLPEAMARVNRKHRNEELKKQLDTTTPESSRPMKRQTTREPLNMEDPEPGPMRTLYWFVFRFGRFANGVLLAQPIGYSVVFVFLVALGSVYHSLGLLVPGSPGPNRLFGSGFPLRVVGGGVLLGVICFFGVSFIFNRVLQARCGKVGKGFGYKVVAQAFAPLAVLQIMALIAFSLLWGEAFWRGATPAGFGPVHFVLIPLFWLWGGFRLAQALCGLFAPRFLSRLGLKGGLAGVAGCLGILLTHGLAWLDTTSHAEAWAELKSDVMQSGAALPIERYDRMEKQLGFRDVSRRRELYLWRLQAHYIRDDRMAARADALRLDRMEPPGSPYRELARGLNLLMQDRLDMALVRFESALEKDPGCLPAHQWMALAYVGRDLSVAESHARRLMGAEPNVFHLQVLVHILFARNKHQEIWDVMLTVDAPPEEWDPLTLAQGGISARALGKYKRADILLDLARRKGLDSDPE